MTEGKQRSGDSLISRDDDLDYSLVLADGCLPASYLKQLIEGRITDVSLRNLECKQRFEIERVRRVAELKKFIKKHAPAQDLGISNGVPLLPYDHYEGARQLGIDYHQERASIDERPFPNEDVEAWNENVKYIHDFACESKGLSILDPRWSLANEHVSKIRVVHRDTIMDGRGDVADVAKALVLTLADIASQLDTSDEQAWPTLSSKT